MKTFIVSIIFILLVKSAIAGGGWVYKKGQGFVKLSQSTIYAESFFNKDGGITDIV